MSASRFSDVVRIPNPPLYPVFTARELLALPSTEWLIEGVMPVRSLACLYGKPASGKSFVALDLSASVATGSEWASREVKQGNVLYVIAEGAGAFHLRLAAWMIAHELSEPPENLHFITESVYPRESDSMKRLTPIVADLKPILIVIDTLAMCYGNANENDAHEMNGFLHGCRELSHAGESAILIVHHPPKDSDELRGSGALLAGVDLTFSVKADPSKVVSGGRLSVIPDKAKDWDNKESIHFTAHSKEVRDLLRSFGGSDDRNRTLTTSLYLIPQGSDEHGESDRAPKIRRALEILGEEGGAEGLRASQWEMACGDEDISESTCNRARKDGLKDGAVGKRGDRYVLIKPEEGSSNDDTK